MQKKKKKNKKVIHFLEIFTAVCCGLFFLLISFYMLLQTHKDFSANFADYVLRPVIGSQATVSIESIFFAVEDIGKKIQYHFEKPDARVFSDTKKISLQNSTAFTLTPIPAEKPTLPGEGIWSTIISTSNSAEMAQTFLRPDPQRSYAIVALVKINTDKLGIGAVAGTWEPGESQHRGPGMVPLNVQQSNTLVAVFNGGFQKKDGAYGMIVGSQTILPLQKGLATLVLYDNKDPQLIKYTGQDFGKDVTAIRQNGPMLIENGKIVTDSSAWNMQTWGLTTTNTMYTWRSGLGITATGDLIYAVGPSLVPETLATALEKAGAINAMQLDINPVWVRFALYTPLGNGKYTTQMLLKDMSDGALSYLRGYQKDFFYVYKKPVTISRQPLTIFVSPTPSPKVYTAFSK